MELNNDLIEISINASNLIEETISMWEIEDKIGTKAYNVSIYAELENNNNTEIYNLFSKMLNIKEDETIIAFYIIIGEFIHYNRYEDIEKYKKYLYSYISGNLDKEFLVNELPEILYLTLKLQELSYEIYKNNDNK